jgi:hypothetical protein
MRDEGEREVETLCVGRTGARRNLVGGVDGRE